MTDLSAYPPSLSEALAARGYDRLTPVQDEVTKPRYQEADLLVSAQTGSGKTVGFGLAIARTILGDDDRLPPAGAPLALVIAPTRELALQVKRELAWLYEKANASLASCVGGMDMRDERRSLDRGAHIVVGTPGRIKDHILRQSLDLGLIRAVVLDEADEMLDLGFREDLEFILGSAPAARRTLMFSATVPRAIEKLAQDFQRDALRVSVASQGGQHADITYQAMQVAASDTEAAIINSLRYHEAQNAIIFCNTRVSVNRLTTRLSNRSFSVVALSGELSQQERTHALQAMRDGRARVCVATDVAARGIDLPNLELVIHADLPSNSETLLHRSGRTGRAGKKGTSILIASRNGRKKAENLLRGAKVAAEWIDAPTADAVRKRDDERLLADPIWSAPADEAASDLAARLLAAHGAKKIAAAYVQLYLAARGAPEELAAESSRPDAPFGPSRWFAMSIGRNDRAEPRWILPMLCRRGGIGRGDVGAIRVQESETWVEVLETAAKLLIKTVGPDRKLEGDVTIRPLSKPPFGTAPAQAPAEAMSTKSRPAYERPAGEKPTFERPAATAQARPKP
ncbi:MAG: DEAD/DEAH box helicase, partial [Paracoccaceae bacterium]